MEDMTTRLNYIKEKEQNGSKLLYILTVPQTLAQLRGQAGYMKERGFYIYAVTSPGIALAQFQQREHIQVYAIKMHRKISPFKDVLAICRIRQLLRRIQPHIVHASTPKAGLLGTIAAWLAGVPVRVYQIRGLPLMTATGFKRKVLWTTERIACSLAHRVLCNSDSIMEIAIEIGICNKNKLMVNAKGSSNGVEAETRFNPHRIKKNVRTQIREKLAIPENAHVIGFIGRLVRDKGIADLAEAWQIVRAHNQSAYLIIIGPHEKRDSVPQYFRINLENDSRVRVLGYVPDVEMPAYYAMIDVLAFPTYREGFPNVILEAAAMGLPVVASAVPGCIDAVIDGVTGTLVPPRNPLALANALIQYTLDPELRSSHGRAGRERVLRDFRPEMIWKAVYQEYIALLKAKGLPLPTSK